MTEMSGMPELSDMSEMPEPNIVAEIYRADCGVASRLAALRVGVRLVERRVPRMNISGWRST